MRHHPTATPPSRRVRDCYGRPYQVGPDDRLLTGGVGRRALTGSAWAVMLGAGTVQYGFALVALVLHGTVAACAVLGCTAVFQAAAVPAAHRLRAGRPGLSGALVLVGGACCAGALAVAAVAVGSGSGGANVLPLLLGYGVLGGAGAGLVYGTCADSAAHWHPERAPAAVALVTGGYAYGAVLPLTALLLWGRSGAVLGPVLAVTGGYTLLAALVCGALLRDPPSDWWPVGIDPRRWTLDRHLNRSLRRNHPALWDNGSAPGPGDRTWQGLYAATALVSAVLLFDIARLAVAGPPAACAAFAAGSGIGRSVVGRLAERLGRGPVLAAALTVCALAQPGLAAGLAWAICCATLAGAGAGVCFPVLVGLLRADYGRRGDSSAFAVLYSAKALGAAAGCGLAAVSQAAPYWLLPLPLLAVLALRHLRRPLPALLPTSPRQAN